MLKQLKTDWKVLIIMLSYWLLAALLMVSLTSVFTFIHFLIGHDIATLEYWLFSNTWEIVFSSLLGSAYVIWNFISVRLDTNVFFKQFFGYLRCPLKADIIVVSLFVLINLIGFYEFKFTHEQFSYLKNVLIALGVVSFFLFDFILINHLRSSMNVTAKISSLTVMMLLAFKLLFLFLVVPYKDNVSFVYLFNTLISYIIYYFYDTKIAPVVTYVLCLVLPLSVILPFDLIYAGDFSLFSLHSHPTLSITIAIWLVAGMYLVFKRKFSLIDDQLMRR
jgi:hypothetical protein